MAKGKEPASVVEYRRKQKRGGIMKPETFQAIKEGARRRGATDPEAVAGAAYWNTAEAKARRSKKK